MILNLEPNFVLNLIPYVISQEQSTELPFFKFRTVL